MSPRILSSASLVCKDKSVSGGDIAAGAQKQEGQDRAVPRQGQPARPCQADEGMGQHRDSDVSRGLGGPVLLKLCSCSCGLFLGLDTWGTAGSLLQDASQGPPSSSQQASP